MHKICFTISLLHASTCFEYHALIVRKSKLYYTASGIITPIGGIAVLPRKPVVPENQHKKNLTVQGDQVTRDKEYWRRIWRAEMQIQMGSVLHFRAKLLLWVGSVLDPHKYRATHSPRSNSGSPVTNSWLCKSRKPRVGTSKCIPELRTASKWVKCGLGVKHRSRAHVGNTNPSIWRYSPIRALASLIRRQHSSLFSALLLHSLIPSSCNASLWTTSAHLILGLRTGLVV